MLTAQQKTMRRFWYAIMPISHLAEGPKPFRLMNEDIVLFLDADGEPAALRDRCCHRTAKLSKGWMDNGTIVCGYHGWTYDRSGRVIRIPQYDPATPPAALPGGLVPLPGALWLCLGRAGRPAAAAVRNPGGRRTGVPPDLPVLRPVVYRAAAFHGKQLRQRAFRLRASRHVRRQRAAEAEQVRDRGDRIRLRRDHGRSTSSIRRPRSASPAQPNRLRRGPCATTGTCRSAAAWT